MLDALLVVGTFLALGPTRVCSGEPPSCELTTSWTLRWWAVVLGAFGLFVILVFASVDRREDRTT
jgi:hypothetical protein